MVAQLRLNTDRRCAVRHPFADEGVSRYYRFRNNVAVRRLPSSPEYKGRVQCACDRMISGVRINAYTPYTGTYIYKIRSYSRACDGFDCSSYILARYISGDATVLVLSSRRWRRCLWYDNNIIRTRRSVPTSLKNPARGQKFSDEKI